tara:strand:- start:5501 stop:6550 length:1050 start_codon:yes stop_codon:yes gene_type:complete
VIDQPSIDPSALRFDLPDPEKDDLSNIDFLERLEDAWSICEQFDLQTEIWRGRILRVVRDREKKGGDGRGTGFLQWLRDMEISKSKAYTLIQLADSSDDLVLDGILEESSVNNFSKRAFLETAQAVPEIQHMISEAANEGKDITRRQVKNLTDQFLAATSPLLPDEIRERTQSNLLPAKFVAPLVRELSKLSSIQQEEICETLRENPEIDSIKDMTNTAKWIGKSSDASLALRAFQNKDLNFDKATQEAFRLDSLGLLSDAFGQAKTIESSILRFHSAWKRLEVLQERLWLESGSSTPHLRELLDTLQTLTGSTIRVSLGELSGGKNLRLQLVEEDSQRLEPPSVNTSK